LIVFSENIPEVLERLCSENQIDKILALADENTAHLLKSNVFSFLQAENIYVVPAGEINKNLSQASKIWEFMALSCASRKSLLINFGGGMITDLGGFCASTFMRGIPFVNVPTSLLGMVDASIGGKTGINHLHLKNYIGSFQNPLAICINTTFLKTLPKDELISGWAEVIKHGIIRGGKLWELCKNGIPEISDTEAWKILVELNTEVKQGIVESDPREKGLRKSLNLGHTLGHAIETWFLQNGEKLSHGAAVAAGMIIESHIAVGLKLLQMQDYNEIAQTIDGVFPKLKFNADRFEEIARLCLSDKKNQSGRIFMVLPKKIGEIQLDVEVNHSQIIEALNRYARH
jgi:3-dehydroquinate synthase